MAKIYYDPDEDELIPVKKGQQTKPSGNRAADADRDSVSEQNDILREIADAVERNNTLLMRHEAAEEARHQQNRDSAISAAGAVIGWKVVDGLTDAVEDCFKSLNPFESSCGCKKKKWF